MPESFTFATAVEKWLQFRARSWSAGSERLYRLRARGWIIILGEEPLGVVGPLDVQRLYLARDNGHRSASWLNQERRALRGFFEWARGLALVRENPVTPSSWPRKSSEWRSNRSRVFVYIDPEMLQRILDLAPLRYHRILLFLYLTALRVGEAMCARWNWVEPDPRDPDGSVLRIPAAVRKQRRGYCVPLGRRALEVLGRRGEPGDRIFAEAPSASAIRQMLLRIGRRIGIERLSPHQFRRSAATALVNSGMPLPAVQRFVGWKASPREWMEMLDEHYYLGLDGPEARAIQDRLHPRRG